MKCPMCNARMSVRNTRPEEPGTVVRYRRCTACPYSFKTMELDYHYFMNLERPAVAITATMERMGLL